MLSTCLVACQWLSKLSRSLTSLTWLFTLWHLTNSISLTAETGPVSATSWSSQRHTKYVWQQSHELGNFHYGLPHESAHSLKCVTMTIDNILFISRFCLLVWFFISCLTDFEMFQYISCVFILTLRTVYWRNSKARKFSVSIDETI